MRALKKVLHEMPRLQIHNFSSDIIKSIKVDSIAEFFDAMTSGQPTRKMMSTTNDPVVSDYDHQRVLVLYTREAFSSPYEPTHAMTAFLEYLDVQWLSMIKAWVPNEGTRQSRGGTIVQSSCAGKSRLVERYNNQGDSWLSVDWESIYSPQVLIFKRRTMRLEWHQVSRRG